MLLCESPSSMEILHPLSSSYRSYLRHHLFLEALHHYPFYFLLVPIEHPVFPILSLNVLAYKIAYLFIYFWSALLQYNLYAVTFTNFKCTVWLISQTHTHTESNNYHHNHEAKHFHCPPKVPCCPFATVPSFSQPLPNNGLLFCHYSSALSRISYQQNPTVHNLLCSASSTLLQGSSVLLYVSVTACLLSVYPRRGTLWGQSCCLWLPAQY